MTEQEQRADCITEGLTWIGTPFIFSGTLKHIGVACGPFLVACFAPYAKDSGRVLPNPKPFPRDWALHTARERFLDVILAFCAEVETPQPGDVALFRLGAPTRPFSHGALVIEWPGKLLHAFHRGGVEETTAWQLPLRPELAKFYSPWAWKP